MPGVEYPGDDCCFLYDDTFYRKGNHGNRVHVCHDGVRTKHDLRNDFNFHDELTSYYCGKNTWYNICSENLSDQLVCSGDWLSSGAGHAKNPDLSGFNNSAD